MSRKRKPKSASAAAASDAAAPAEEILAEGSGPVATDLAADAQIEAAGEGEGEEIPADINALAEAAEAVAEAEEAPSRGRKRRKGRGAVAAETAPETAVKTDAETAVVAGTDAETAAETGTDAETAAEADAAAEAATDAGAETELATASEPSADPDADAVAELEAIASGEPTEEAELEAGESAALPTSAASMDAVQLKQLVEALIFASDRPITVQRLRQLTRVSDMPRLEATLAEIATDYEHRGLVLQQVSGGYQFRTRPQFSTWVQQLIQGRPVRLSRAQLETLAIVAYRQPITRPEIDDIRGVDSSATLKLLMDRQLIRSLGKKEEVGRPTLFGTTKEFLDFFSLGDLRELPTLREYSELTDESRQVMTARLGLPPDGSGSGGSGGSSGSGGAGGDSGSGGNPFDDGSSGGGLDDASASASSADTDLVAAAIDDLSTPPDEMFAAGSTSHLVVDEVLAEAALESATADEGVVSTDDQLVDDAADLDAAAFDGELLADADLTPDPAAE